MEIRQSSHQEGLNFPCNGVTYGPSRGTIDVEQANQAIHHNTAKRFGSQLTVTRRYGIYGTCLLVAGVQKHSKYKNPKYMVNRFASWRGGGPSHGTRQWHSLLCRL